MLLKCCSFECQKLFAFAFGFTMLCDLFRRKKLFSIAVFALFISEELVCRMLYQALANLSQEISFGIYIFSNVGIFG